METEQNSFLWKREPGTPDWNLGMENQVYVYAYSGIEMEAKPWTKGITRNQKTQLKRNLALFLTPF